ncbi:MAG: hypothetical protein ACI9JN_001946 [Bacteroidia bacterium]|jgi:hypothetical protein
MTKGFYLPSMLLTLSIITIMAVAPSCGPTEEDIIIDDVEEDFVGFATDALTHTYVVDKDPCPQPFVKNIEIFCFEGETFTECDADSVVINGTTPGLKVTFINGLKNIRLSQSNQARIASVEFTCAQGKSFMHTYTLVFYKAGIEVSTEEVLVEVTVVEP